MNTERPGESCDGGKGLPVPPVSLMGAGEARVSDDSVRIVMAALLPQIGAKSSIMASMHASNLPHLGLPIADLSLEQQTYRSPIGNLLDFDLTEHGGVASASLSTRGGHVSEDIYYVGDKAAILAARAFLAGMRTAKGEGKFKLTEWNQARVSLFREHGFLVSVTTSQEILSASREPAGQQASHPVSGSGMRSREIADVRVTSSELSPTELRRRLSDDPKLRILSDARFYDPDTMGPQLSVQVVDLRGPEGIEMFKNSLERL